MAEILQYNCNAIQYLIIPHRPARINPKCVNSLGQALDLDDYQLSTALSLASLYIV